jgi:hypothetical protein
MNMMNKLALFLALLVLTVSCKIAESPQPIAEAALSQPVTWDTSPSATIVRFYSPYTTAGSQGGSFDKRYYIPEVQLWGDGRIVWVRYEGVRRQVLEGQLTTEQMQILLQQIVEAGFFEWDSVYYTLGGHSSAPRHLQVNLVDRAKEISEHGGAPEAFYQLVELLLNGAGATGHDYVPTQGFLSLRLGSPDLKGGVAWPEQAAITPEVVGEGRYIEGEILEFVWEIVNRNPLAPVYVRFEAKTYLIMIQIPGLSYYEPS